MYQSTRSHFSLKVPYQAIQKLYSTALEGGLA